MTEPLALWTLTGSSPGRMPAVAAHAEAAGWAGLAVVDSQNLTYDCYVLLAVAAGATSRLGLATGVTNPITRHPAATAGAIASIQRASRGRAVLGIGRGDSALAHLGRAPARVADFERYVATVQRYLRGETVPFDDLDFHEGRAPAMAALGLAGGPDASRLGWLGRDPKVPVAVAATGPKVIAAAARTADRVLLAVGADPERLRWGIDEARRARRDAGLDPGALAFGAYVNLVCHPDVAAARDLVRGGLASFARFAVMQGAVAGPVSDAARAVLTSVHRAYDMREHTRAGAPQTVALTADFIDRYAVVGPPDHCRRRLEEIRACGVDKVVVVGPAVGADRRESERAIALLEREVVPGFAAAPP